jgi:hypothetical protein
MSSLGWYVDSGASKLLTYYRFLFKNIYKKEDDMGVELGDGATYPMRGVGSIYFKTPTDDVLELSNVLCVPRLKKNLYLVSCMIDIH